MVQPDVNVLLGVLVVGISIIVLIGILTNAVICFFLHKLYKAVPVQRRQMTPGLVWLLLIPLFGLIWNFFVFPKLSGSYKTCFEAAGDSTAGTCNSGLAWAYPILCVVMYIPLVSVIAGPAALVVVVAYIVKMFELKGRLEGLALSA
jgi:hypothetical protein